MINKQKYLEFVVKPHEICNLNSSDLNEITERFPYCQTSQLLYLISLLNDNNIRFPEQLKITAAYAGDRGVLKKLIEQIKNAPVPGKTEIALQNLTNHDPIEKDDVGISGKIGIIEEEEPIPGQIHDIKIDESQSQALVSEILHEIDKVAHDELHAEVNAAVDDENLPPILFQKSIPAKSKDEIINQFIENAPRITRSRTDFFNPVDYARNSTIDKEDIVSETLAQIYYGQGNIAKALKIYEKLSLRYPDKSSYFAALITKIKSDNNLNT